MSDTGLNLGANSWCSAVDRTGAEPDADAAGAQLGELRVEDRERREPE